jgi:hypothetical protein
VPVSSQIIPASSPDTRCTQRSMSIVPACLRPLHSSIDVLVFESRTGNCVVKLVLSHRGYSLSPPPRALSPPADHHVQRSVQSIVPSPIRPNDRSIDPILVSEVYVVQRETVHYTVSCRLLESLFSTHVIKPAGDPPLIESGQRITSQNYEKLFFYSSTL